MFGTSVPLCPEAQNQASKASGSRPLEPSASPAPRLTRVAVMKKFQGINVPRPSTKKISHTALYLGRKEQSNPPDHLLSLPSFPAVLAVCVHVW